MSRIEDRFARLAGERRKALVPFVTAGDPDPALTVPLLHEMVAAGADIIELGVPFSDPMADGPTIQRASERALAKGMTLRGVLSLVATFRQQDAVTPIVLMGYANPIEAMGVELFADAAATAGVDGVLVVDYPPQECARFAELLRERGLNAIFLLAPTSSEARFAQIARIGSGYIYYVSLKGVTGAATLDVASVAERLGPLKAAVGLPVCVGFGIRDAASARQIGALADGVVIGSRLIEEIEQAPPESVVARVGDFLRGIRQALDSDIEVPV